MKMRCRCLQAFLLFTALTVIVAFGQSFAAQEAKKGQEVKKGQAKKEIPLGSVYFTDEQAGLKLMGRGSSDKALDHSLRGIYGVVSIMGASNVLLVAGNDIGEAVRSTWEAFCHYGSAGQRVRFEECKSEELWLVVYFGIQSGHGTWAITSVEVNDKQIRLSYKKPERRIIVTSMSPELAWAPLGKLEAGTYTVELFNGDEQQVVLMRRVIVPKK